jgi:hypothetical protein
MPRRLLLAACALAIVPAFAACGDDDDADAGNVATSTTSGASAAPGTNVALSSQSPTAAGPASRYSVTNDEIGLRWFTDVAGTLSYDLMALARTRDIFASEATGEKLLKEWGYQDGYVVRYIPEQRDEGVKLGAYYITIETHRYKTPEGAMKAYAYYSGSIGAAPAEMAPIGNKSVGYSGFSGKIPRSTVNAEFKQIIFTRGNVVAIVLTSGAQGFMKMQDAWDLAHLVDQKILGEKPSIEPTPTSNYATPTPTAKP